MLKIIGKKRLPKGTAKAVKEIRSEHEWFLERREVVQITKDYRNEKGSEYIDMYLPMLPDSVCDEEAILMFRDVGDHDDDWRKVRHNGRFVSAAFVHIVIHGRADIFCGGKSVSVEKGDVFAIDMNKRHSVRSNTLCITACVTVPKCTL